MANAGKIRCLSWTDILPLYCGLAEERWSSDCLYCHWRDTNCLSFDFYSDVHIWKAGAYVDGEAEVDGEVLASMTEQFGALEHRPDLALLIVLSFGYSLELAQRCLYCMSKVFYM